MNAQTYDHVKMFAMFISTFVVLFQIPASSGRLSRSGNDTQDFLEARQSYSCTAEMTSKVLINLTSTSRGYDPRIRPNYGSEPVNVTVWYSVLAIRDIQEVDMTYVVDMYFRQQWLDERLKHSLNCTLTFMTGTKHPADFIWVGDATFENAVTSYMHNVLTNNHKVDIYPNGTVIWGARVTTKALCPMNLASYPFDVQVCPLTVLSYTYPIDHVRYDWKYNPGVTILLREQLSQYTLTSVRTNEKETHYALGTYCTLNAYFTMERRLGYFLMQVYTPCMFLVVLAGFSFWVDPRATPARVALSLTTLLTTATIWSAINSSMPKVNYIKAVDIYFLTSFGFVFSTLLQYIFLLALKANMYSWKIHKALDEDIESKGMGYINGCFGLFKKLESTRNSKSTDASQPTDALSFEGYSALYYNSDDFDKNQWMVTKKKVASKECSGGKKGHHEKLNSKSHHHEKVDSFDPETMNYYRQCKDFHCILSLDKLSRVIYLLCYLIFNLTYWFTYYRR